MELCATYDLFIGEDKVFGARPQKVELEEIVSRRSSDI